MNGKSVLIGIVTGAVVGSITTLLSAPKSGKDMQQLLKNNYEQLAEFMLKGKKESLILKDQITKTAKISAETLKTVSSDIKDSVDVWRKDVEPTLNQLKLEMDELQKSINNRSS